MKIIQPYDIDAMILHYAQHKTQIHHAEEIRQKNAFENKNEQTFERKMIFHPSAQYAKSASARIDSENGFNKKIPQGALNIDIEFPACVRATDSHGIQYSANLFPAGSLYFHDTKWRVMNELKGDLIKIHDKYYTIQSNYCELSDAQLPGIKYHNAYSVNLLRHGLVSWNGYIIASDSDKYFGAGTTIADAHNQLFRDFYNKTKGFSK